MFICIRSNTICGIGNCQTFIISCNTIKNYNADTECFQFKVLLFKRRMTKGLWKDVLTTKYNLFKNDAQNTYFNSKWSTESKLVCWLSTNFMYTLEKETTSKTFCYSTLVFQSHTCGFHSTGLFPQNPKLRWIAKANFQQFLWQNWPTSSKH